MPGAGCGSGGAGGDGKQGRFPAEGPRAALPVPAPAAPGRGTHEVWQFGVLLEELLERQGAFLQGDKHFRECGPGSW